MLITLKLITLKLITLQLITLKLITLPCGACGAQETFLELSGNQEGEVLACLVDVP